MVTHSVSQVLKDVFGFAHFRTGQQQVIEQVVKGHSAAAIFPTGSGKSLCYQLPAVMLPGITLVVSPLLALMKDQLEFLAKFNISAASIDSSQSREQGQQVMQSALSGQLKVLMVSVERFNNERFRKFLAQLNISLLVVDEAHCISEWGHNFRPDYLKLPQLAAQFQIPQVLLLTATATQKVIGDMCAKFAINDECVCVTGFHRDNLHLQVKSVTSNEKLHVLEQFLHRRQSMSGIIYVTLQKTAEQVAEQLQLKGLSVCAYHAGLDHEVRDNLQQKFLAGDIKLMVATIAFGMGIDKSNIRYVVHYDLPKSIENYAQEIGRAGRDGLTSDCLVLANLDNLNVLQNFIYGDTPSHSAIAATLECIFEQANGAGRWELVLNSLSTEVDIKQLVLKTLLVYLEMLKVIEPAFSFFAEYKFKMLVSESELIQRFGGERAQFVEQLIACATRAKTWWTFDFDLLEQRLPNSRDRALKALEYFDEQHLIELQAKQMTQVFQVDVSQLHSPEQRAALAEQLYQLFSRKEQAELNRIDELIKLFTQNSCLSNSLAGYFTQEQLRPCGHCSVCLEGPAVLPPILLEKPLAQIDVAGLLRSFNDKYEQTFAKVPEPLLQARYLCGLTTPVFTKMRARSLGHFATLEKYPFGQVLEHLSHLSE